MLSIAITYSYSQEIFSESFDASGSALPDGWSQVNITAAEDWSVNPTSQAGGAPNELAIMGRQGLGTTRLITPAINLSAVDGAILEFKVALNYVSTDPLYFKIQTSSNGTTWVDENFKVNKDDGLSSGITIRVPIKTLEATTYIAWVLEGDHNALGQMFIDDVVVEQGEAKNDFSVSPLPFTEEAVAGGSTVNKTLTINNNSGVTAVWDIKPVEKLAASWVSGTGRSGNMFNIETGSNAITISGFDCHMYTNEVEMELYYRVGSYVGYETNAGAWIYHGKIKVEGQGTSNPTFVPFSDITIPANSTYGFYITTTSSGQTLRTEYAPGSFSDDNITITTGTSNVYPFGTATSGFSWNGNVYYEMVDDHPQWLSFSSETGILSPGTGTTSARFHPQNLNAGTYEVLMAINGGMSGPGTNFPITLTVTGVPDIDYSEEVIDFGDVASGTTFEIGFPVTNTGTADLELTNIGIPGNELFYTIVSELTIKPGETKHIGIFFYKEEPQTGGGTIWSTNLGFDTNIDDNKITVTVRAAIRNYTIFLEADPEDGGSVNGGGSREYEWQEQISAETNPGYEFVKWEMSEGYESYDINDFVDDVNSATTTLTWSAKELTRITAQFNYFVPSISTSPASISQTVGYETNEQRTLTISNTGEAGSILNWTAKVNPIQQNYSTSENLYDVLDHFSTQGNAISLVTDGQYIYTGQSNSNAIQKYNLDGTHIESFTIDGITGLFDITYDGQYFYGVDNTRFILKMDFNTRELLGTIRYHITRQWRAIGYDEENDAFWVSRGLTSSNPMKLVNRSGGLVQSLQNLPNVRSYAYDNISADKPYLWVLQSDYTLNKIDIAGDEIVETHDISTSSGITESTAVALNISNAIIPGKWVFLGLSQDEQVWMLDLADLWLSMNKTAGQVSKGDSESVTLHFSSNGLDVGTYTGAIEISSSDPATPTRTIPVSLNVFYTNALTVSADPAAGGDPAGAGDHPPGSTVDLDAKPNAGYTFAKWTGDTDNITTGSITTQQITITMPDEDISLTANYNAIDYTLSVDAAPASAGTVSRSPDQANYIVGNEVTLTANPATGYGFTEWTGHVEHITSGNVNTAEITVTMPADDIALTANFESPFDGGVGSEGNPWQITNATQLNNVRHFLGADYSHKHFKVMNDINLADYIDEHWPTEGWLPIGTSSENSLRGKFDGGGNKITALIIDRPTTNYVGIFGYIGVDGEITDLGIEIDGVLSGGQYVGGISGFNKGSIENCYVIGEISGSGDGDIGGITGSNNSGTINNCFATGAVSGSESIGGLAGSNLNSSAISNSYFNGNVSGSTNIGGIVGRNTSAIINSYTLGEVEGSNTTGGLVGEDISGTITNCYSQANVTCTSGSPSSVGGFIGYIFSTNISNSYSTGSVYNNVSNEHLSNQGFSGSSSGSPVLSGNFWNTETSGADETACNATGLTTSQMRQQAIFEAAAWGFSGTWSIISADGSVSYPYLTGNVQDPYPGLVAAWNGVGNWDETGNWFESTVPGEGADVRVHTGHLTINHNVDVGVMTVAPSASLTLEADNTLTASSLTMESHGKYVGGARDNISVASFVNLGTVDAGVIEYQRYVPAGAFEYISSPLTGQKSDVFAPLSDEAGTGRGLFSFDEAGDKWEWFEDDENVTLGMMHGYAFITDVADIITFSGKNLHSGYNFTQVFMDKDVTGFHLIGNPYASSVDWGKTEGWDRYEGDPEPAISPVVWINYADAPGEGNFATYHYESGVSTNWSDDGEEPGNIGNDPGVIPPTQAFWVLVNERCTLQVNREAQVHSDNVLHKKSAATVVNPMLRLQAETGGYRDEMVVFFHESATEGLDRYDTRKKMGSGSFPQLYTSVSGTDLAVNALPVEMLEEVVVVPVTLHSPGQGTYTISLTELRGFDLFTEIHLADRQKDVTVSLRDKPVYSFDLAATGDVTGRFEIIIGDNTVTGAEELTAPEVCIYSHGRLVHISGAGIGDRWEILNMLGMRLLEGQTEVDGTSVISTNLPVGIYMVVVHTAEGRVVNRVYIE